MSRDWFGPPRQLLHTSRMCWCREREGGEGEGGNALLLATGVLIALIKVASPQAAEQRRLPIRHLDDAPLTRSSVQLKNTHRKQVYGENELGKV